MNVVFKLARSLSFAHKCQKSVFLLGKSATICITLSNKLLDSCVNDLIKMQIDRNDGVIYADLIKLVSCINFTEELEKNNQIFIGVIFTVNKSQTSAW